MLDYTFFGRVNPERASLTLAEPIQVKSAQSDSSVSFDLVVHVYANQIVARVICMDDLVADVPTLRNFVTEQVQSVVDLCGFLSQSAYEVEMVSYINNDHPERAETFGVRLNITGESVEERAKQFTRFASVIGQTPWVALALSDLRAAITNPMDTGMYCYRAFESILSDFKVGSENNKKAKYDIEKMGVELNIGSAQKLKAFLGKHAGDRRHGKAVFISWEDRKEVMKRAWTLMDRYLEYLQRGRNPLPDDEFPKPSFEQRS